MNSKNNDRPQSTIKPLLNLIAQKTWNFFISDAGKRGFEDREGQQDMAFDIVDAITNDQHIAVEAAVGIGKSFAYIVPAMLYNHYVGKPVAIATSTIALQEQLAKDIETVSGMIKYYPQIVFAKGQTHYICLKRAEEFLVGKGDKVSTSIKEKMRAGIFDQKDVQIVEPNIWKHINIKEFSIKTCSTCSCRKNCHYVTLRAQMLMTNGIIVCNQDLLTAHLQKVRHSQRPLMNEDISLLVVDEAHNLETKVRNSQTNKFTKYDILNKAQAARKTVTSQETDLDRYLERISVLADTLYKRFENQIREKILQNPYEMKYADSFSIDFTDDLHFDLSKLEECISELNSGIDILYDEYGSNSTDAIESFENIAEFFRVLLNNPDANLYWLEKSEGMTYFCSCPKNIAKVISNLFFDRSGNTILTSATLANSTYGANREKYAYFITNTGFPTDDKRGFLSDPKPSPFNYDSNTMIYYCSDLPHPTKERSAFVDAGTERLIDLLKISDGRALVLFTAQTDLEEVYERLCSSNLPYKLLTQSDDASQEPVLTEFRENVSSVLLGTGAYWEGVNIEGESLSNLVIFRLPFPVPDPIIDYKRSMAKDPLMDVNVPEMIIKLKQGVGRLIRSSTDRGIISIIDPRIGDTSTAPYKDMVWNSLPIRKKTSSMIVLDKFYNTVVRGDNRGDKI